MNTITKKLVTAAAISAITLSAGVAFAQDAKGKKDNRVVADPFGIEIGKATCDQAKAAIGEHSDEERENGARTLKAKYPGDLFDGAKSFTVVCVSDLAILLELSIAKGGPGSNVQQGVFNALKKNGYKLVKGGPMPSLGNGMARFTYGDTRIWLDSPHLSFEFTLSYMDKVLEDALEKDDARKAQKARDQKSKP